MHWLDLISKLSDLFLQTYNTLILNQTRHSQVWFCWPPVLSLNTTLQNSTGKLGLLYCTNDVILGHTTLDTGQTLQQPINNIYRRWRAMTFLVTYCDYFSFFIWCLVNVLTKYVAVGQLAGRGCSSKEKLYREHCEVHEMDGLIEKFCYCSFNLCNTANNRIDKVTLTTQQSQHSADSTRLFWDSEKEDAKCYIGSSVPAPICRCIPRSAVENSGL